MNLSEFIHVKLVTYLIEGYDKSHVWYHGSFNKFDTFNTTNDIGYHFGTKEQALDRLKSKNKDQHDAISGYLYQVSLDYKNPLSAKDMKTWFGENLLDLLSVNKLINRKEALNKLDVLKKKYKYDENNKIVSNWSNKALNEWNDELKNILYSSNYDAIIYKNKFEDKASSDDSIVVFNENQIHILDIIEV